MTEHPTHQTLDALLLAHIQHTNAGTGASSRRPRIDPATWMVTAALVAIAFFTVVFAGR